MIIISFYYMITAFCIILVPIASLSVSDISSQRNQIKVGQALTSTLNGVPSSSSILTNVIFKISYDGTQFHGWSAANSDEYDMTNSTTSFPLRTRSRRNRNRPSVFVKPGHIRTVQGVLQSTLSKLYGNVNPNLVQVEGSSRTDKGVHAHSMIAMIYCLKDESLLPGTKCSKVINDHHDGDERMDIPTENFQDYNDVNRYSIPGKRYPHPISTTDDTFFKPIPFGSDLRTLANKLNKMLPPDIRILDVSPTPHLDHISNFDDVHNSNDNDNNTDGTSNRVRPFHPSLDTLGKTYKYTFTIIDDAYMNVYDPTRCRTSWNVIPNSSQRKFCINKAHDCMNMFIGKHDFNHFKGAFRGNERGKTINTICSIQNMTIQQEGEKYEKWRESISQSVNNLDVSIDLAQFKISHQFGTTYTISITGDRFLYKMVRFLVGTVVQYAMTKDEDCHLALDRIRSALQNSDTTTVGKYAEYLSSSMRTCAPANGLSLHDVIYHPEWKFDWISHKSVN